MIGSMIRQTNELDHHDADTVTQRLRSGVDRSGFVMWRSPGMMLPVCTQDGISAVLRLTYFRLLPPKNDILVTSFHVTCDQ
ncbi:hypothetical protein TNCV_1424391 [Trichonephila clavipes]|nr:hypothetical protein TNCV_1424391 [Trichonephila clavipes]